MPSRRFHSKNRHGCIPCKTRRVKCNLARPTCSNCARRNEACILIGSEHAHENDRGITQQAAPNQLSPFALQGRSNNSLTETMRPISLDMYFLERYFSHVCPTLSSKPEIQRNWAQTRTTTEDKTQGPPHYLTHLQIAISGLHYSLTQTDGTVSREERRTYLEHSIDHQNAALAMLRPVLCSQAAAAGREGERMGEVRALFGAAWLIFLFNLTFPRSSTAKKDWIVDEIVGLSELAKGVVAIMLGSVPHPPAPSADGCSGRNKSTFFSEDDEETANAKMKIMTGPLRPFFSHFLPWKHESVPASVRRQHLPVDVQHLFSTIESMKFENNDNEAQRKRVLYLGAIAELELTVTAMRIHTQHPSIAFMWLIGTKREFMELIRRKDDEVALRILRVYGRVMQEVETYWWASGLGRTIVDSVDITLGKLGGGLLCDEV